MSLGIIYNDQMVTDKRMVLAEPHGIGQTFLTKKQRVSKNKHFAFFVIGPGMSDKEMSLVEAVVAQSLTASTQHDQRIEIEHAIFFYKYRNISLFVMTAHASFYLKRTNVENIEDMSPTTYELVRFDPSIPAGQGTGYMVATIALREGVTMENLTRIVSRVINTVGPEYDITHRSQLKAF